MTINYLKRIHFDSTRQSKNLGFFLVVVGSMILAFAIHSNLRISAQLKEINQQIDTMNSRLATKRTDRTVAASPEAMKIIETIRSQINYPWSLLLSTLEAINTKEVHLLSIQPNIDKKQVLISAEATDIHQMLEYIHSLETQHGVEHVELLNQIMTDDNQHESLNFSIMMKLD